MFLLINNDDNENVYFTKLVRKYLYPAQKYIYVKTNNIHKKQNYIIKITLIKNIN